MRSCILLGLPTHLVQELNFDTVEVRNSKQSEATPDYSTMGAGLFLSLADKCSCIQPLNLTMYVSDNFH